MKKINSKHGLQPKEEIKARRLKDKILKQNDEEIKQRLEELYNAFGKKSIGDFYNYIKEEDVILYSAFERVGGISKMYNLMSEYKIF